MKFWSQSLKLKPLSIGTLQGGRQLSLPVDNFPEEADEAAHCVLNTLEDLLCPRPCLALPLSRKSKAHRQTLSFIAVEPPSIYHLAVYW